MTYDGTQGLLNMLMLQMMWRPVDASSTTYVLTSEVLLRDYNTAVEGIGGKDICGEGILNSESSHITRLWRHIEEISGLLLQC